MGVNIGIWLISIRNNYNINWYQYCYFNYSCFFTCTKKHRNEERWIDIFEVLSICKKSKLPQKNKTGLENAPDTYTIPKLWCGVVLESKGCPKGWFVWHMEYLRYLYLFLWVSVQLTRQTTIYDKSLTKQLSKSR